LQHQDTEIRTYGQAIWDNRAYLTHAINIPDSYGFIIEACAKIPASEIHPRAVSIFQNLTSPLLQKIHCDWEKAVAFCLELPTSEIVKRAEAFKEKVNIIFTNMNEDVEDRGWWDFSDRVEIIVACLKLSAEQIRALPNKFFEYETSPFKITKFLEECKPLTPAQIAAL
jgi:hypothetical protein